MLLVLYFSVSHVPAKFKNTFGRQLFGSDRQNHDTQNLTKIQLGITILKRDSNRLLLKHQVEEDSPCRGNFTFGGYNWPGT